MGNDLRWKFSENVSVRETQKNMFYLAPFSPTQKIKGERRRKRYSSPLGTIEKFFENQRVLDLLRSNTKKSCQLAPFSKVPKILNLEDQIQNLVSQISKYYSDKYQISY
jgi:hypothetical protein